MRAIIPRILINIAVPLLFVMQVVATVSVYEKTIEHPITVGIAIPAVVAVIAFVLIRRPRTNPDDDIVAHFAYCGAVEGLLPLDCLIHICVTKLVPGPHHAVGNDGVLLIGNTTSTASSMLVLGAAFGTFLHTKFYLLRRSTSNYIKVTILFSKWSIAVCLLSLLIVVLYSPHVEIASILMPMLTVLISGVVLRYSLSIREKQNVVC